MFKLPKLPYEKNALEPYISEETLEYHYGKHSQAYVTKLNALTVGSDLDNSDLEDLIKNSEGGVFNNAAQVYNHSFYWDCMAPNAGGKANGEIARLIDRDFGDFDTFKEKFSESAINNFGSGWTWLVKNSEGKLEIINTGNADTVITTENKPLLVVDVWEHSYYIDTRNDRAKYLENFWHLVNWSFVNKNLSN
ncbi:superoxide dismutase [Fe] [Candidatus Gracilibacteria bacterium]|nr:MAG: superoxide dismutase [Fe] [Candidatus Gracilibacteria bacterium]